MLRILRSIFAIGFATLLTSSHPAFAAKGASSDWKSQAKLLTAESASEKARKTLQDMPDLDRKLTAALEGKNPEDRGLAYQVISALGRKSQLPRLLELAQTEKGWQVFATLGTLIDSDSEKKIADVMRSRITAGVSDGAKVAILQSYGKLKPTLEPGALLPLLSDSNAEVKIAAAELAGRYRVQRKLDSYDPVLLAAVKGKPYQLRLEALRWIDKTPESDALRRQLKSCLDDSKAEVKKLCSKAARS